MSKDDSERRVTETATQARQANWGKPVLVVLVCALLLTMIAWAGVAMWGESIDTDSKTTASSPNDPINAQPSGQGTFDNNAADGSVRPPEKTDRSPTPSGNGGGPTQVTTPSGAEKVQ